MKKILCVLVLTCVIMGTAFAQAKPAAKERKNAVALDIFPLLKGIIASNADDDSISTFFCFYTTYERLIVPHFSIGPVLEMYFADNKYYDFDDYNTKGFYFNLAAEGRYYPSANFDKFFVGATLGISFVSWEGKPVQRKVDNYTTLNTSLKMGYKVITSSGFYMEPSLSYVLARGASGNYYIPVPAGWQGGLRLGFAF